MTNSISLLLVTAVVLGACAPVIETRPTTGLSEGYVKTLRAEITPWFTVVGNKRVVHDANGTDQTVTPVSVGALDEVVLPGSESLPEGRVVHHRWSVNYAPILFPFGASTVEASDQFEVGPPARIAMDPDPVCVRLGSLAPVEVALAPAPPPGQTITIGLATNPASVTLPQTASLSVGQSGNSVNVQGIALGDATLIATAAPFVSETVDVEVIEALATTTLRRPVDGETDVFFGNNPPQGPTVPVFLEWDEVPGAIGGSQRYDLVVESADGSQFINTNSSAESIALSLTPETEYRWRVRARFEACGGGTEFGPFSDEFTFTTFGEET